MCIQQAACGLAAGYRIAILGLAVAPHDPAYPKTGAQYQRQQRNKKKGYVHYGE
jgi:hypothetical protein